MEQKRIFVSLNIKKQTLCRKYFGQSVMKSDNLLLEHALIIPFHHLKTNKLEYYDNGKIAQPRSETHQQHF